MKEAHDETLESTMYGTDTGGERWLNERHPDTLDAAGNVLVQGALKHLNGASVVQERQHNKRAAHLFGHLYKHLADTRLREMIFMQAQSDGRAAYLVLNQACRRDITDLEIQQLNHDFNNSSIEGDIGVNADSMTSYSRYLVGLNAKRPESMRKDDNAMTLQFLHAITGALSPSMQLDAMKEIRAPVAKRQYMHQITGMRDFSACVADIDMQWRTIFRTGQIASQSRRQPGGVRIADVSVAEADDYDDEEAYYTSSGHVFSPPQIAAMGSCWNCRGLDHVREQCPSPAGMRSLGLVLDRLRSTMSTTGKGKGKGKGKGAGKGSGKGAGAGKGKGGRGASAGRGRAMAGRGSGAQALYAEAGALYSTDGSWVAYMADDSWPDEHDAYDIDEGDEQAHTALASGLGAYTDSDSEGDAWMDALACVDSGSDSDDSASANFVLDYSSSGSSMTSGMPQLVYIDSDDDVDSSDADDTPPPLEYASDDEPRAGHRWLRARACVVRGGQLRRV